MLLFTPLVVFSTLLFTMYILLCSRKYAVQCSLIASRFGLPPFVHPSPLPVRAEGKHGRLRIGYVPKVSSIIFVGHHQQLSNRHLMDFADMLVVILVIILFPISWVQYSECMTVAMLRWFTNLCSLTPEGYIVSITHQLVCQVFCYALSQNDGTEWRQRIQAEAEHFIDVSAMTSDVIAKMINEDKIQILINLNGYTKAMLRLLLSMACHLVSHAHFCLPVLLFACIIFRPFQSN
jgi:protein O-GlcNAc transferase